MESFAQPAVNKNKRVSSDCLLSVTLSTHSSKRVILLSCHQIAFFHLSTHFLAFSLNLWRSSKVQGSACNWHCNICLVVLGAWPHSHIVSPLKYIHLLRCFFLHATPVRNLLRHLHAVHGLVCPFAKLSSSLTAQLCCTKFCRCCHSLQRMIVAGKSAGRTELRKHSLFKRLSAGTWPCRERAVFVSCFFFSTLAHTSLLMSGGTIPTSRYSSSTLVGLKHPVIDLHASFSSGSSLDACGDLAQTWHAYSAAE